MSLKSYLNVASSLFCMLVICLVACKNPPRDKCTLDIHNELEESVEDLDALRLGYHRAETDPRKVFQVAVGMTSIGGEQIKDLTFMDAMRTSQNVDCQVISHKSGLYIVTSVSLEDNNRHLRSVKSRIGVNPDTVLVLALVDSTQTPKRIYIGGGEHTVRVVDFD